MLARRRFIALLALALAGGIGRAAEQAVATAEAPVKGYESVEVAASKTSIYLGYVSMRMPTFARKGEAFESTYVAKVVPFVFYNESGKLSVQFTDEMLRQLERGEAVDFKGLAVRDDGAERPVTGRATPAGVGIREGKIKVRVAYSKKLELIFNTSYRFPDATAKPPAGGG